MKRQGYEVTIGDHGGQLICVFYEGHGGLRGARRGWDRAGADAVGSGAAGAWGALNKGCSL
jgi:hypothetical protein